jgi:predicted DNA-binding transcriptional regulator AlpA
MPKMTRICPSREVATPERKIAPARTSGGPLEDDPLIGTSAVAHELMCHPVTVFRYMRERPDFPIPIRISSNRLAWRLSAIRAYVASRPLRERRNKITSPRAGPRGGSMADNVEGAVDPDKSHI